MRQVGKKLASVLLFLNHHKQKQENQYRPNFTIHRGSSIFKKKLQLILGCFLLLTGMLWIFQRKYQYQSDEKNGIRSCQSNCVERSLLAGQVECDIFPMQFDKTFSVRDSTRSQSLHSRLMCARSRYRMFSERSSSRVFINWALPRWPKLPAKHRFRRMVAPCRAETCVRQQISSGLWMTVALPPPLPRIVQPNSGNCSCLGIACMMRFFGESNPQELSAEFRQT